MTTDPDPAAEEDAELLRREREYYLRLLEGIRADRVSLRRGNGTSPGPRARPGSGGT
jgi:hypothetical protein